MLDPVLLKLSILLIKEPDRVIRLLLHQVCHLDFHVHFCNWLKESCRPMRTEIWFDRLLFLNFGEERTSSWEGGENACIISAFINIFIVIGIIQMVWKEHPFLFWLVSESTSSSSSLSSASSSSSLSSSSLLASTFSSASSSSAHQCIGSPSQVRVQQLLSAGPDPSHPQCKSSPVRCQLLNVRFDNM